MGTHLYSLKSNLQKKKSQKNIMVNSEAGDIRIMLDDLTPHNIKQFKMINQAVFPVQYVDAFYRDAQKSEIHFSKLAYFNDLVVGGVCFRLEDASSPEIGMVNKTIKADQIKQAPLKRAYIMTLGVLTPYRRYGVGKKMLDWVIEKAKSLKDVSGIYLHVQTNNDAAKAFYEKNDFSQEGGVFEGYYKKIDPPDAYMLKMDIEVTKTEDEPETKKENEINVNSTATTSQESPSNKNSNSTSNSGNKKNKKKGGKGKKKK